MRLVEYVCEKCNNKTEIIFNDSEAHLENINCSICNGLMFKGKNFKRNKSRYYHRDPLR